MTVSLKVDWNADGDFSDSLEDVTDSVWDVTTDRGRTSSDSNPLMGRCDAGKLVAVLDNRSGRYSSQNSSSPLAGLLDPGKPVSWSNHVGDRYYGYIKNLVPTYQQGTACVRLEAAGVFSRLASVRVTPPASSGDLEGALIDDVLDAAGWGIARAIDAGQSTSSRWFVNNVYAFPTLRELEELGLGFLLEDPSGNVVYQDRSYRRTGAALVSQATYSDAPGAAFPYSAIAEKDPEPYVVNEVVAAVTPYTVAGIAPLWTLTGESHPVLAPGQTRTWVANIASGVAYVEAWTTPVIGSDITQTGVSNSDLAVVVIKNATTMVISVTNNHVSNSATLTLLQARGTAVTSGTTTSVISSDSASQIKYGLKSYRLPAKWLQNTSAAQAYADFLVNANKEIRPLVDLKFVASMNDGLFTELMNRQISDRVTVVAGQSKTALGINADFFVERIQDHYDVQKGGRYDVTLSLSKVGPESGGSFWIVGTSALDVDTYLGF